MLRRARRARRIRRLRRILGILVAAFIVLGAVAPPVTAAASATSVDTMHSLVNQARFAAGLPGVLRNSSMDAVAEAWANQMGSTAAMSHNPQYSAQIPAGWNRAGENVAEGYPTPQAIFNGWMKSPGHRANILGDYTDIGIAFVRVRGKTWGVQDFGKYLGHVGPTVSTPLPSSPSAAPTPSATSTPVHSGAADSGALDARAQAQQTAVLPVIGAFALAVVAIGFGFWYVLWRRARRQPRAAHRGLSPRSRARG